MQASKFSAQNDMSVIHETVNSTLTLTLSNAYAYAYAKWKRMVISELLIDILLAGRLAAVVYINAKGPCHSLKWNLI